MCVTENTTHIILFITFHGHCVTIQDFVVNLCMVAAGITMIFLNGVVLHTLLKRRDLDDPGNHFITNLAAADSLSGLFVIYDVCYNILQYKNYTECVLRMGFFQAVNVSSVITLAALTCDRYIKICYPYFYNRSITTRRVRFVCLAIWFCGILVGMLPVMGWSTRDQTRICQFFGIMEDNYLRLTIVLFYIPFAIMTVVYIRLILLARQHSRAMANMTGNNTRSVWRSVKTASMIVGAYFICWAPVGIFMILVIEPSVVLELPLGANVIFTYLFGLGLINSLLNPIIYATKISFIKSRYREICCWCRQEQSRGPEGFRGTRLSSARASGDTTLTRLSSYPNGNVPEDELVKDTVLTLPVPK